MRVAYLTSQYPAPSHTFIRREVQAVRERGVDIQTFSIRRPPAGARMTEADVQGQAETVYILPAAPLSALSALVWALAHAPGRFFSTAMLALRHRVPGVKAWLWSWFYFIEAMMLARALKRRGIDHLHNHFANPAANVGLLATRFLRMPWSLTLHGISELDYPAGLTLGAKIHAARFVACVSHFGRAQAMRLCDPVDWPKLFIARCSVDTDALQPRTQPASGAGGLVILCVGRLSPEKGHVGLVQAFAKVRAAGIDARLRLVGDGPDRSRIDAALVEQGMQAQCDFTGQLSEAETLQEIARADVLVSASFMEGLPVVLMEAMALLVPVVAPRVAGIPELVEDGVTGLLFHPGDFVGLGDALIRLLQQPGLRATYAETARQRVQQQHGVQPATAPMVERFLNTGPAQARATRE